MSPAKRKIFIILKEDKKEIREVRGKDRARVEDEDDDGQLFIL